MAKSGAAEAAASAWNTYTNRFRHARDGEPIHLRNEAINLVRIMKHFKPTLATVIMTLALLAGGYTAAQAQNEGREPGTENGEMQQMMQDCPMMNESESAERCPMMAEMMQSCPMMKQMMKDCPMMRQMMQDSTMMKGMKGTENMGQNGAMQDMHMQDSGANATMKNGVQTADVTVGPRGFEPSEVALKAGVPARLTFTRTVERTCATQVQIPAFGIGKTHLPLTEPVSFEFTPEDAGSYAFSCGMNMMRGTLNVTSEEK